MSTQKGYTLVELMIVVVILGVLVSIAMPLYGGYTEKTRRTHATTALMHMSARQANIRTSTNTYTADFGALGYPGGVSEGGYYEFDFTVAPDTSRFTLRARPMAGAGQDGDDDCRWFTIDHRGRKNSGPENCWAE